MSEPNNNDKSSLDGMYICMVVVGLTYLFGGSDDKGVLVKLAAAVIYGPILGFFAYFIGQMIWILFTSIVQEASESAQKKGVPAPFALLWGIIVGLGVLYLMG